MDATNIHLDHQWTNLLAFYFGERRNQEADSGAAVERSHSSEFIALWVLYHVGTEEGWDLQNLY